MMVTDVATESAFQAETPQQLFQRPYRNTVTISAEYDVTSDDQRFF